MSTQRLATWAIGRAGVAGAALLALAGCISNPFSSGETPQARVQPARAAPPEPMTGRWMLASPGGGQCGMTFGGQAGAAEGTIAPEGGCPGNFFTSRKWTFEQGSLVIRDHNGQPLGQLAAASPGRFDGQATNGQQVTLTR